MGAQTFTQRIQQQKAGQGTVVIHQDADIDRLVNSEVLPANPTPAQQKAASEATGMPSGASADNTTDETSKAVGHGYRTTGYRVQAFAGGNSRRDRQQAESIGNAIRSQFPGTSVYVHFYSPRWICRVGNYRTYEEAHQMLVSLRAAGYTQASIVKGKIIAP